jgi:hypothetical protein
VHNMLSLLLAHARQRVRRILILIFLRSLVTLVVTLHTRKQHCQHVASTCPRTSNLEYSTSDTDIQCVTFESGSDIVAWEHHF